MFSVCDMFISYICRRVCTKILKFHQILPFLAKWAESAILSTARLTCQTALLGCRSQLFFKYFLTKNRRKFLKSHQLKHIDTTFKWLEILLESHRKSAVKIKNTQLFKYFFKVMHLVPDRNYSNFTDLRTYFNTYSSTHVDASHH